MRTPDIKNHLVSIGLLVCLVIILMGIRMNDTGQIACIHGASDVADSKDTLVNGYGLILIGIIFSALVIYIGFFNNRR